MKYAKYIILRKDGLETAVLLHPSISHDEAVGTEAQARYGTEVLSAGFFAVKEDGCIELSAMPSTSLRLDPRPQDAEIIERTLFLTGLRVLATAAVLRGNANRHHPVAA